MTHRNFMNSNEVFPILDLINRKLNSPKASIYHTQSPLLDGGGNTFGDEWKVKFFEVTRDTENTIDPSVIKEVYIEYLNGASDTITITRGLNPPVDNTVQDYEYINNLMIVELTILTEYNDATQEVIAKIFKENGYGLFQKVELTYNGTLIEDEEEIDNGIGGYDNPNDFFDGETSSGYDEEIDDAQDFEEDTFTEADEPIMPESGWADGSEPSTPIDIPFEES